MAPSGYWGEERLVWLRRAIVDEKLTATQAAIKYFPTKSRNAIIGAVHRHLKHEGIKFAHPPHGAMVHGNHEWRLAKLAGEEYVSRKVKRVRNRAKVPIENVKRVIDAEKPAGILPPVIEAPPVPPELFVVANFDNDRPLLRGITIMGIREGLCRFPMWNSKAITSRLDVEERLYCGHATHRGLVYCDKHHGKCNTGSHYVRRGLKDGEGEEARAGRPVHQTGPSAASAK